MNLIDIAEEIHDLIRRCPDALVAAKLGDVLDTIDEIFADKRSARADHKRTMKKDGEA